MLLTAMHYAVLTNRELVGHGVPAEQVTFERERHTGHTRRVQPRWARAIGMWGGIATLLEIAERVDVDVETAHAYAKFRKLRWRTKKRIFTPSQLGALCLATIGTAREVATKLGLLPVEVCVYRAAMSVVLIEHQVALEDVLRWHPHKLNQVWGRLSLRVEAPDERKISMNEASLESMVKAVEQRLALERR